MICHCAVTLPALAVIVASVVVDTALVWISNPVPLTPAGIVTVAGPVATGESVERFTKNPPGPARPDPSRSTHPDIVAPPVAVIGFAWNGSSFRVGGRKVNWFETDTPLSVAVRVTSVGTLTGPTFVGNCAQAMLPGIVIVGGTGARLGCELDKATVAPPAGTAALSCTATMPEAPLYMNNSGLPRGAIDTGVAGAELIENVPTADQSVSAFVPGPLGVSGEESPCCERTRQHLGPDVSDSTVADGSVYWL